VTPSKQGKRNLNPHKPARIAMILYGRSYASQGGGSMDFWDSIPDTAKEFCRQCVAEIEQAPKEERDDDTRE
jgi:hypothetical protein